MLLFLLSTAFGACPEAPREALTTAAAEIEIALAQLDDDAMADARSRFSRLLRSGDCIAEPLTPTDAATVHRARSVLAFSDRDWPALVETFAAARSLHPATWQPAGPLLGHSDARQAWRAAGQVVDASTPFGELASADLGLAPGGYLVDGTSSDGFPDGRAFIVQALDDDGKVAETVYAFGPADVPLWRLELVETGGPSARAKKVRRGGSIGAGFGLLAAGGLGAFAAVRQGQLDSATNSDELSRIRNQSNGAAIGAGIVAGASLSVGIVSWGVKW